MVEDLLSLAAIESPGMEPRLEPFNLSELSSLLSSRFVPRAEQKAIIIDFNLYSVDLSADTTLLLRAVSSIIDNAIKYAPSESRIIVSSRDEGDTAVIAVQNQGGIDEKDLPHIFDRLYRGESSRHSSGSGLGLTIARAVAELHGGTVHAYNRDGFVEFLFKIKKMH
jgi:signal transduction histidine kinase